MADQAKSEPAGYNVKHILATLRSCTSFQDVLYLNPAYQTRVEIEAAYAPEPEMSGPGM